MKLDQVLGSFPATWALLEPPGGPMTPAISSNPGSATEYCYTGMITIIIHNVHCMYLLNHLLRDIGSQLKYILHLRVFLISK